MSWCVQPVQKVFKTFLGEETRFHCERRSPAGCVETCAEHDRAEPGRTVIAVALFDTLIAVAAGVAIFPIIFASNLDPAMGPALIFVGVPYAFGNMAGGELYGGVFFLTFSVVAIASALVLADLVLSFSIIRLIA